MNIPLCKADIGDKETEAVSKVLHSGWLAHGPQNDEFEENFAKYIGVKKAVSLNSCTSALQLAIQAQRLKGEVIVPGFTFVASANAIETAGCKPIFVDIEDKTCNIDPSLIEKKITKKTCAIMPVHYAGQCCKMDAIMEIAQKHDLKVIEDSAECIGGEYLNKRAGSFGIGCFSFYPTKNMTTGEGGMLTSDDEELVKSVKALRGHGIVSSAFEREKKEKPWLRAASFAGYNYRLCDILAAIGVVQLKKLDQMNEKRIKNSKYLTKQLASISEIETPYEDRQGKHVYQMYTLKVSKKIDRTIFLKMLREKGIGASVHFDPPVHLQPYYMNNGWKKGELKVTEDVSQRIVTLPMFPSLTKEEMDYMVQNIESIIKEMR